MSTYLESLQSEVPLSELDMLPKNQYMPAIVDTVGVLADIKPVAMIEEPDQRIVDLLTGLGLEWDTIYDDGLVIASKDGRLLDEMRYWTNGPGENDEDAHREVGRLLGYPPTATDYFMKRIPTMQFDVDEQLPMILPVELEGTVRGLLHHFVLSPDHWQQEIDDYVVPLEQAVRDFTPETYRTLKHWARRQKVAAGIGRLVGHKRRDPFSGRAKIEWVE